MKLFKKKKEKGAINLQELLNVFSTEEAKVRAIEESAGKIDLPESLINQAVEYFKRINSGYRIPRLYEKLERINEAIRFLEENQYPLSDTIKLAKKHGLNDKVIELCERMSSNWCAAEELKELNPKKAAEYYIKAAHEEDHKLIREDLTHKAANLLTSEEKVDLYKTEGMFNFAANEAERIGRPEEALELYKQVHAWRMIARIYEKKGDVENAIKFYLKDNDYRAIAWIYRENNRFAEAVEYYEKHGDLVEAMVCSREARLVQKTEELLKRLIRENHSRMRDYPSDLGYFYEKAGKFKQAMFQYERALSLDKASEMAQKLGLQEKIEAYAKIKEVLDKKEPA